MYSRREQNLARYYWKSTIDPTSGDYSNVFYVLKFYNKSISALTQLQISAKYEILINTVFLNRYYYLNDILWQEGFFIDFAQKKSTDKFVRKFLIVSAYLFSERVVFDKVIRVYSDLIFFVSGYKAIYYFTSVSKMLLALLLTLSLLLVTSTILIVVILYDISVLV